MKRTIQGFTMIEVLVAVVVASLGMLGIAGTLLTATRSASSNYLKQQAVQSAYDIVDRMRANYLVAKLATGNPYNVAAAAPVTPGSDCTAGLCSAAAMAAYDVYQWQTILQKNLPNGLGSVTTLAGTGAGVTTTVTVTVTWSDQPTQATYTTGTGVATSTYQIVTAL